MKTICFASHNPAKLQRYQKLTADLSITLVSLRDLEVTEKVSEPYSTSQENARHKAQEYARIISMPVLTVDEEMRTNFLPEKLQPGVLVRRLGQELDRDPTDQDVIDHWLKLIQDHPHPSPEFYWDFSIAYYDPERDFLGEITVSQVSEVASYVSDKWHPGYPMSTFMSPKGSGKKPYWDIDPELRTQTESQNFQSFLERVGEWIRTE